MKIKKRCVHCKEEFISKKNTQTCCSLLCRNKFYKTTNGFTKKCLICQSEFYVPKSQIHRKFCSPKCRNGIEPVIIKYVCRGCGKEKETKTKQPYRPPQFCKSCILKNNKKRHKKSSHYDKRRLIASIGRCELCGYKEHAEILGIHHKDKNHINNNKDNLIILCPMCHSLAHSQHLPHSMERMAI